MIMPRSPSMELLRDYSPESIDPQVEEVPAKDVLISVSVKIIGCNEKRSEHKTFMLRDIDVKIGNIRSLKQQILDQFGSEFVNQDLDFNVGYHKGTTHILVRTQDDLTELLHIIQSKSTTQLWCDGVDQQKCKKRSKLPASEGSSDSDNDQYSQTAKKK